jgi:polysaccharide biosynthesis transport protein
MYDSFLQKYTETVQQQSFPITEARSISPASSPQKKSHPRSLVILALGLAGGFMLGTGAGFLRDQLDRVFRTSGQVDEFLHLKCVSIVPAVKSSGGGVPRNGLLDVKAWGTSSSSNSALSYAVKSPFSRFAESVRAIKVAVDLEAKKSGKTTKVIGVCSSLPNEGKSTVATNLAQVIAMSGARTVLVDCDLRNPSLSRALAPDAKAGILDVLAGNAPVDHAFRQDPTTNLVFAPIALRQQLANTSEIFSSERMKRFFEILRERFDYVIVDLPPLAPVIDARATTHLIDFYLFVVEWGRTKIDVAQHALSSAPGIYDQTIGVVLNNADMRSFARYQGFTSNYYNPRHYERYGYVD